MNYTLDPTIDPNGYRIGEGAVVRDMRLDRDRFDGTAHLHCDVPANAYAEIIDFIIPSAHSARTYGVMVIWLPNGVWCKPGCKPFEPLAVTIRRLERALVTIKKRRAEKKIAGVSIQGAWFHQRRVQRWLKILRECARYEWSAE